LGSRFLITFSLFFFFVGIIFYRKTRSKPFHFLLVLTLSFVIVALFAFYGVANYFSGNGIDEATIYHLRYGLYGAGFGEYSGLITTTVTMVIASIFILFLATKIRTNNRIMYLRSTFISIVLPYFFLSIAIIINPASVDLYKLYRFSFISIDEKPVRIKNLNGFNQYYRKPYIKKIKDGRSFVFIYAESLERTYFDEALFPGLIKGLKKLEAHSIFFTDIKQVVATGWTVGGIVASQCGIPLFSPSHGNTMLGMDQFLASSVCIGDLLREKGYRLFYMGGASLDFAGKGKFFNNHGFHEVIGRGALLSELEDNSYKTDWGLYDDSLFDLAYQRFVDLSEADVKFGLFTLTLDTHHPSGHPSDSCNGITYQNGNNPILNAVACSDYLITEFVEKIIQSPYGDRTIIVIASDHLALNNTASDILKSGERRNLFMIIDPMEKFNRRITAGGSTLDIAPTLLPFIGYKGDVGLGRNLLDENETLADRRFIQDNLSTWKESITGFWNFPVIKNHFIVDLEDYRIRIDHRTFRMPILIELNDKLETTLRFDFYRTRSMKSLFQFRQELDPDKYFLMIDKCKKYNKINPTLGEDGYCFMAGKGQEYFSISKLEKSIYLSADELRVLLKMDAPI
jgi:phosphoglycerol transferase